MISLTTPLSELEITELDEFLVSEATPGECMDISALDGFLTALVIGPGLVPTSAWIRAIWGGKSEPTFESSAQAQRVISLIMPRFNAISSMFNDPPEFAPILYERDVDGTSHWSAGDWCWGFLIAIRLAPEMWQPLVKDEDNRSMLLPLVALGIEDGWKLLEAEMDPDAAAQAALNDLEPAIVAISRYWRGEWRRQNALLRQDRFVRALCASGETTLVRVAVAVSTSAAARTPSLRISLSASRPCPPARAHPLCVCPSVDSSRR